MYLTVIKPYVFPAVSAGDLILSKSCDGRPEDGFHRFEHSSNDGFVNCFLKIDVPKFSKYIIS